MYALICILFALASHILMPNISVTNCNKLTIQYDFSYNVLMSNQSRTGALLFAKYSEFPLKIFSIFSQY